MASIRDKNLLFYSIHPNDDYSKEFMKELDKYPPLKKQFILICVNDPNIRIPDKIKQLNKVPVLVAAGFSRPILGNDAVSWLKNGGLQEKANGFDYGSLQEDVSKFAFLGDELKPSDYNQFYNSDYNHGFTDRDSILNQQFSKLNDNAHITTYDDANELKKDISAQLEQRLSQLKQQRDTDVPRPVKRIGGLDDPQNMGNNSGGQNFMNGNRPGNGAGLAYNPNPFGNHNMGQQSPQLPFAMPAMAPMNMPQMNMPQMGMPQMGMPQMNMPQVGMPQMNMPQMGMPQMNMGPNLPFNMGLPMHSQPMPQLPFQVGGMPRQNTHFKNPNL